MMVLVFILRMVFRVVDDVDDLLGRILPAWARDSGRDYRWVITRPEQ